MMKKNVGQGRGEEVRERADKANSWVGGLTNGGWRHHLFSRIIPEKRIGSIGSRL